MVEFSTVDNPKNVILIVADDYGAISASSYADKWQSERYSPTPTIDTLCDSGLRFERAWTNPTCSPTRAALLTGRYSFRTGVGAPIIGANSDAVLDADEPALPRVLAEAGAPHARLHTGKWHLGATPELGGALAPNAMGWEQYAGNLAGAPDSHYAWERTENGTTALTTTYSSTQEVDDAIRFLKQQEPGRPFVLWHAPQAPHAPLELPPNGLHDYDALSSTGEMDIEYFEAMAQAMDHELNRLLSALPDQDEDGLPDDTTIVFVGDNGTSGIESPFTVVNADPRPAPYEDVPTKGTLYEHGARVPLCIAGAAVRNPGRRVHEMVHAVDLYSTVLELAGVSPSEVVDTSLAVDSRSLVPLLRDETYPGREYLFAEQFFPPNLSSVGNSGVAITDGSYKWIRIEGRRQRRFQDECYDIGADPLEQNNLLRRFGNPPPSCEALRLQMLDLVCSETSSRWRNWCPAVGGST